VEHGFFKVVSSAAFRELLAGFPKLGTETVALGAALGRVLAADVVAGEDLPPASRSSMDGYAVRAADLFGATESNPAYLERVGEIAIDRPPDFALNPGECASITTGGFLPEGADSVIMVEHSQDLGAGTVELRKAVAPHDNVMLRGEDVAAGQVALPAGKRLRPPEIGLLAALGQARLRVGARPRVAILSTGDELVPVTATPRPGQIRDVNSATLAAIVVEAGAEPQLLGLVPDELDTLAAALRQAREASDVILLSGGSSVGVRDLTIAALATFPDARVLAHGIQVSPGKPTILAALGEVPVLGLPGQVTSAQVVMRVFGAPFLRHLAGQAGAFGEEGPGISAELARNLASKQGREDWVRVRLESRPGALPLAHPVLGKSGLLRTLLSADGLVAVPSEREGLYAGSLVVVRPL